MTDELPNKGTGKLHAAVSAQPDALEAATAIDPNDVVEAYHLRIWLIEAVKRGDIVNGAAAPYHDSNELGLRIGDILGQYIKVTTGYQMPGDVRSAIALINDENMPRTVAVLTNGCDVLATDEFGNEGIYVTVPRIDDAAYRAVLHGIVSVGEARWAVYGIEDECSR